MVTGDADPGPGPTTTSDEDVGRIVRFDAGWMGCDRMPMIQRRQLQAVDVGDVVEFVVYDPSSKEDVPSFARMLGHRVRWINELDDGGLVIAVQRMR